MSGAWTFAGEPATAGDAVTLVEGATFCVSDRLGDITPDAPLGLFVRDTRVVSGWRFLLDGEPPQPLSVRPGEPFEATIIARARPRADHADSTLVVVRHRLVGDGMRERITVRNVGPVAAALDLELLADADFADPFAVKESRVGTLPDVVADVDGDDLAFAATVGDVARTVRVAAEPAGTAHPGRLVWQVHLEPRASWTTLVEVTATTDGQLSSPRHFEDETAQADAFVRSREWRHRSTFVSSRRRALSETFARSVEDLGALRIFDAAHPHRLVVAAGAPWFMALFGRDSLLTSWMLLPVDRHLALGTLRTLAERQGRRTDPVTEEQPGRILHEVRFGPESTMRLGGGNAYYGTVDATPLFVMLVAELWRWGAEKADVEALLPHVDRALEWITDHGDLDGDGFVEYQRMTPDGLENQGWKDSGDGVCFPDGQPARTPVALAEVQGYVYAAYRARADLARWQGDDALARRWDDAADTLRRRFDEAFWLPERQMVALGLDADKRPIDSLASNVGHCLWTGIVTQDKAGAVADHLLSPAMFTGWGVRTLAATEPAHNPLSYHNGSVWPHDTAIAAAGLARYGFADAAARVAQAQLEAAEAFGGRLPELFCGFDRDDLPGGPLPYPAACSPQAWASAAPFLLLRALLGLEPDVPAGVVQLAPAVPERYLPLIVENVMLGEHRATIRVLPSGTDVRGLPDGVEVRLADVRLAEPAGRQARI